MDFLKNLKDKVVQANPELAEKTTQALKLACLREDDRGSHVEAPALAA